MKGYRFYEEFTTKLKDKSAGNCLALYHGEGVETPEIVSRLRYYLEGVGAIFLRPNSEVAVTGISREFLRERCKRVSEKRAREIHPILFEYIDREE